MVFEQGRTDLNGTAADNATAAHHFAPLSYSNTTAPPDGLNHLYARPTSAEDAPRQRKKLAAEKIFDLSVYGVWNYGIQVGTSVAASMWFQHFGGKPYFNKAAQWLGENVMTKVSNKTAEAAVKEAHSPLLFISLITVGSFFIPPMRYVEKDKEWYVSKINDWLNNRRRAKGEVISDEELKHQQEEIEAIAAQPRQSSASLWTGRFLGLGANFLAQRMIGTENDEKMKNAFANAVSHGLDRVGAKGLAQSETMKHFSRIALLDYGYSIISSNVVYIYSHFIHPEKESQSKPPKETPATQVDTSHIQGHTPLPSLTAGAAS